MIQRHQGLDSGFYERIYQPVVVGDTGVTHSTGSSIGQHPRPRYRKPVVSEAHFLQVFYVLWTVAESVARHVAICILVGEAWIFVEEFIPDVEALVCEKKTDNISGVPR